MLKAGPRFISLLPYFLAFLSKHCRDVKKAVFKKTNAFLCLKKKNRKKRHKNEICKNAPKRCCLVFSSKRENLKKCFPIFCQTVKIRKKLQNVVVSAEIA